VVSDRPIIGFDALCLLCSAKAQFVLKHDRCGRFRLASMQSEAGAGLCRRFGIDLEQPDSLILVEGDHALRDSDAILAIWRGLGWPWRLGTIGRFVPRGLRDPLYRWVARNRYRLFGQRETCWLPEPRFRDRLL
jgi:predicted DCC family thiol-disulfide oxidoreductase YuxK